MADILTTDDVTTERISNIIHQHLAERFTSEISFGPVLPVIRTDYQEGLDYLQIYIVFDGDQDGLDPRWTVRLPARIRSSPSSVTPVCPSRRGSTVPNGRTSSKTKKHELERPHRNSPSPGLRSAAAAYRTATPGGDQPGNQHHLLRRVPRPGQQQRQHTHRFRIPGSKRPRMDADLPHHRSPVSESALPVLITSLN